MPLQLAGQLLAVGHQWHPREWSAELLPVRQAVLQGSSDPEAASHCLAASGLPLQGRAVPVVRLRGPVAHLAAAVVRAELGQPAQAPLVRVGLDQLAQALLRACPKAAAIQQPVLL